MKIPQILAMYLPQFHRVKENDEWWGEGYTEWTAVKKGDRLFADHYQPHIPLGHNYYDLMKKETMQWQAELMKKYNIYGMCFYHYYFQNGRKILERPAENLLRWEDIDMPFCFSWANESWARTWSKLSSKNEWDRISEREVIHSENDDGILLMQNYGDEADWEKHFNYLLPFFRDKRYIRVDNKPVFIIYKPDQVFVMEQMMQVWNRLAKAQGFEGIFFISTNSDKKGFDHYFRQELNYSWINMKGQKINYDELCACMIRNAVSSDQNWYLCGCPGHDNTPRMGNAGRIVVDATPEKFYRLMRTLLYLGKKRRHEFVFINAWNEWAEGMHLEPDERYGYGFLEAVHKASIDCERYEEEEKDKIDKALKSISGEENFNGNVQEAIRYKKIMYMLNSWLCLKEEGKSLVDYFVQKKYNNIAVYGIGLLGKHLLEELKDSSVKIAYGIDRQKEQLHYAFAIYDLQDELPEADVIVVTVAHEFEQIQKDLSERFVGSVVSIAEVLNYVEVEIPC